MYDTHIYVIDNNNGILLIITKNNNQNEIVNINIRYVTKIK